MNTVGKLLERRWAALIEEVKDRFNETDVEITNGLCRDSWETFAWHLREDYPAIELYKEAVKLQCGAACEKLSEFETTVLLAWRWGDVDLDCTDKRIVDDPWEWSFAEQRDEIAEVLWDSVEDAAANDGEKINDRQWADSDTEKDNEDDKDGEDDAN